MHLINVDTMLLEEFFGDQIPSYAILSHTWGKNHEEVHFDKLGPKNKQKKHGYQKIKYLCQQAAKDGLRWAWCDTCCINKSSSAELSEAINSMFQWYRNASVCYAYLEDVSAPGGSQDVMSQFRESRWFTRGWTLQELLAPQKVCFFGQDWQLLGSKKTLIGPLQDIARVNFGALASPSTVPSYSIATRMSWATDRTTTRAEDRAYCMLGILGVHMPLLYGEGQNAFRRLQEELIKISDDETIFAHSGPNVLAKGPEEFSSGKELTILKKSTSTPYSITNAGLRIHMRVIEPNPNEPIKSGRSAMGILNCHYNVALRRDYYIALPMERTGMANTYRKVGRLLQYVNTDEATTVEYQTIFIQLQPAQISRITLLEVYDISRFFSRVHSARSMAVYNPVNREVRIYPTPPYKYETVLHSFEYVQGGDRRSFGVMTFFDLVSDRAGVEVFPDHSWIPEDRRTCNLEDSLSAWKGNGQPSFREVTIAPSDAGRGYTIRVAVTKEDKMAQFVWFLQVSQH